MSSRTAGAPRYGSGAAQRATGPQGTARFCGTCGARIEPGEAFCGQCGSPVGAGADYTRDMTVSDSSRYGADTGAWGDGGGDAPTEAYDYPPPPVVAPYNRGGLSGGPYTPSRFGATPAPSPATSRTNRTLFGLLCLVGSLLSAAGAVYLAIK
jgi:zinc ribbon protein